VQEEDFVAGYLAETLAAMQRFAADAALQQELAAMAAATVAALRAGGKLLICGNGGSAADAQHIAGEFISRLMYDRAPLAALALTTDSSALTATGNDYGFDRVFERQVRGLGRPGDVLLGISTSGRSANVLLALAAAREIGLSTLGFTGAEGGVMRGCCDRLLRAPATATPIVQQVHLVAAHLFCALVERALCPAGVAAGA